MAAVDAWLAAALRGELSPWPADWDGAVAREVAVRAQYHGICGLLMARPHGLGDWPDALSAPIREQAIAASMWELRHRALLAELLDRFAEAGVTAVLLKGSALAYSLYPNPATRERGDSDVLIAPGDRERARATLEALGFVCLDGDGMPPEFRFQEEWRREVDEGTSHLIDLHVQPLNSAALAERLTVADAMAGARPGPRLSPSARMPSLAFLLVHSCLHRAGHRTAPYFLADKAYFGGDRLIWLVDIDHIVRAMNRDDWRQAATLALAAGEIDVCVEGLTEARAMLGTPIPRDWLRGVAEGASGRASYYDRGALRRAWDDLGAAGGLGERWRYLRGRLFPDQTFMRAKYQRQAGQPLALLYLRRIAGLLVPRRSERER